MGQRHLLAIGKMRTSVPRCLVQVFLMQGCLKIWRACPHVWNVVNGPGFFLFRLAYCAPLLAKGGRLTAQRHRYPLFEVREALQNSPGGAAARQAHQNYPGASANPPGSASPIARSAAARAMSASRALLGGRLGGHGGVALHRRKLGAGRGMQAPEPHSSLNVLRRCARCFLSGVRATDSAQHWRWH